MKASVVVPSKGSTSAFAAKRVVELINECGNKDTDIIIKSDQEPAIKFLVDDICKNRTGAKTIEELAPIKGKCSKGVVERTVLGLHQISKESAGLEVQDEDIG